MSVYRKWHLKTVKRFLNIIVKAKRKFFRGKIKKAKMTQVWLNKLCAVFGHVFRWHVLTLSLPLVLKGSSACWSTSGAHNSQQIGVGSGPQWPVWTCKCLQTSNHNPIYKLLPLKSPHPSRAQCVLEGNVFASCNTLPNPAFVSHIYQKPNLPGAFFT